MKSSVVELKVCKSRWVHTGWLARKSELRGV